MNNILHAMFLGFFGGLFVAIMGAWKDTLYEPFESIKFIRSPLIGACAGAFVAFLYPWLPDLVTFACAISLERLTVEFWKCCIRKPPGKFVNPERDTSWLLKRLFK